MQNTSTTYQTLLAGTHRKEVRLIINDNLIFGEGEIFSMSVDGALFGANTLSFGGCVSREIRVKFLPGSATIPRMAKLQPQVRLTNGTTTSEWIPKGTFYIDTREYDRETGTLTLTGYDAMLKAEATYIAEGYVGTWPRPMDDVATEICGLLGLTMDSRTDLEEWDVQLPTGYSMREVLGGIAAAHAGNWIITDEGKLRLIRAADMISSAVSVVGRNVSTYKDDEAFQPITHVTVDVGGEFVVESAAVTDNGRLLRVSCPWGTQAIADDILSSLNGFVYQPYEASGALLDPAVEIGDRVTINGINGLLAVQTLTFNSLCLSDMSAPGEDEIDHEYPYEAVGTREVKRKLSGIEATLYIGPDSIVAKVEDLEEGTIGSVVVEYAVGTSSTTAPTTGWSTSSPQWEEGKYIWQRTVTTYADSTPEEPHVVISSPTCIQGASGHDGQPGTNGLNVATVFLYQRATSIPEKPTGNIVYTFASGNVSGALGNWQRNIPVTDGKPCYVIQTTASDAGTMDTIDKDRWSSPIILVEDGADGTNGTDGIGIRSVTVSYGVSASASVQPSNWQNTLPVVVDGQYLWTKTITDYTDSSIPDTVTYTYAKQGEDGDNGQAGSSVTVSSIQYQAGTSPTTAPTGTWQNNPVTVEQGQYLWTKTTFSDNTVAYGVARQGVNGQNGQNGQDGAAGYSTAIVYLYKRSATAVTIDWTNDLTYNFSDKEIEETLPSGWYETIPSGANPLYVTMATAYSNTGTDAIAYTEWTPPVILAEDGSAGKGVSSIVPEYYLSTSASSPTGGSWSTTPPTWVSGKYIWTRSHIYYDDSTDATTTPVLDNATNELGQKYSELKQTVDGFTLTVTNGSTTSTIKLMSGSTVISSQTISFSGLVSFSALGSKQSQTFIDGGNIKTGTISADMIDVNDLKVNTIWNRENVPSALIQTSASGRGLLTIGLTRDEYAEPNASMAYYREISIYGSRIRFLSPHQTNIYNICIDLHAGQIYPYSETANFGFWSLGRPGNPFDKVYANTYYLDANGSSFGYLQAYPGGGLDYIDENGTAHAIV